VAELIEQPRHEPGTNPDCIVQTVTRGGRERVVINDPRIVFVPKSVIAELAAKSGATHDYKTGQVTFSHMHADGMDELAERIGKFPWYEVNRDRAQYCKDDLYQANFPYVTKARFSNFDTGNNNIRQYMAPSAERYAEGEALALQATRIKEADLNDILAAVASDKLKADKITELTGLTLEDLQNSPEKLEPYQASTLFNQYETAPPQAIAELRDMIKSGQITANNAGRPIDDASLKGLTAADAYDMRKTHKQFCTKIERDQITALMNMDVLKRREVGDLESLTKRQAYNLKNKALPYLTDSEKEQFEQLTNNRVEAMGRGPAYRDDPTTIDDHRNNSKLIIADFVKANCDDKKQVELGRDPVAAKVLASTPFHAVIAPNDAAHEYAVIDFREQGAKKSGAITDAIKERDWDSTPKQRGTIPSYSKTELDGHYVLVVPNRKEGTLAIDKSIVDSRDGAKCELEAIEQARTLGHSGDLKSGEAVGKGIVVAQRGMYHGFSSKDGVAVVLSETLDNPNAGFLEEVSLKGDDGVDASSNGQAKSAKRERAGAGAGRSH
jgi:hypothetical protein